MSDVMQRNGFNQTELGTVLDFFNGKAIKPGGEGVYPAYGSNGLIGRSGGYTHENGIIIGRVGAYCGSIAYCSEKFWASDNTIVAKPKQAEDDILYFSYLLRHLNLNGYAGGAAQPLVTHTVLKRVPALVAQPPIQKNIAAILSAYDDLIENNTRRIQILEQMAQALYREWFVNFRFPGHEKVRLVDSPMGKIPQGWAMKSLRDVCQVIPGYAFKSSDWQESGVPVIKIKNITSNNTIETDDTDFVSETVFSKTAAKFVLQHGDFLLAMTGATAGKVGRLRIRTEMLLNQRVAKLAPMAPFRSFVWCAISSEEAKERFFRLADGAAQPNMSGSQIEGVKLIVPPDAVADSFSANAEAFLAQTDNLYLKNANLRRTRDLLLPKLISGAVDVSKVEIHV